MGRRGRRRCRVSTDCCGCNPERLQWQVVTQPATVTAGPSPSAGLAGTGAAVVSTTPADHLIFQPNSTGNVQNGKSFFIRCDLAGTVESRSHWNGSPAGLGFVRHFNQSQYEIDLYCDAAGADPVATLRVSLALGPPMTASESPNIFTLTEFDDFPDLTSISLQYTPGTYNAVPVSREQVQEVRLKIELLDDQGDVVEKTDWPAPWAGPLGPLLLNPTAPNLPIEFSICWREDPDGAQWIDVSCVANHTNGVGLFFLDYDQPGLAPPNIPAVPFHVFEPIAASVAEFKIGVRATELTTGLTIYASNFVSRPPAFPCLPNDVNPYCDATNVDYVADTVNFPWAWNLGSNASRCTHFVKNSRVTHALCSLNPQAVRISIDTGFTANENPFWHLFDGTYELELDRGFDRMPDNEFWLDTEKTGTATSGYWLGGFNDEENVYELKKLFIFATCRTSTVANNSPASWIRPCHPSGSQWTTFVSVHLLSQWELTAAGQPPKNYSVYTRMNSDTSGSHDFLTGQTATLLLPSINYPAAHVWPMRRFFLGVLNEANSIWPLTLVANSISTAQLVT